MIAPELTRLDALRLLLGLVRLERASPAAQRSTVLRRELAVTLEHFFWEEKE